MAKQVQPILIKLGLEGYEELAKLKSAFRGLDTTVKQSDAGLNKAREALLEYGRTAQQSEALMEGMVSAFKGLKAQADVTGPTFRQLERDIQQYGEALRGSTAVQDRQRASLLAMASGAGASADQLETVIRGLEKLQRSTRPGSSAFVQLGRDVDGLADKLKAANLETQNLATAQQRISRVIGSTSAAAKQQIRDVELVTESLRNQRDELGALEGQARVRRGVADLAERGTQGPGRLSYEEALAESLLGGTPLTKLLPAKAIEEARAEVTRQITQLQGDIEAKLAKGVQLTFQETARSARESARAMAAAFSSPELLNVFNYFDARLGALPSTATGFAQRLRELQQVLANTARSAENYVTAALNVARVQREASAATQGLGAALIRDLNTGVAARSSKNLQEAIGQLQAEMNELDTTAAQGSRRYAENANQVRNLQGELRDLGNSYRHVADMATQAATAQQNAANAVMRNNYLNRAAVRQQEEAIRELGQRVRTAVEGTPLALPAAGQTSAPGTGQAMSGLARRLRGQVEYTFRDPITLEDGRQLPNYTRLPQFAGQQPTAATGVPPAVGFSGRDPSIQRAIPAYKEAQQELSKVLLSSNNTIQSLERQRSAWDRLRNVIDPASSTFANATKRVQELDKRLDSLSAKQQKVSRRGLGAQGLTQIAGAAISGGIFGGPEGFLGGVAGGALGGVGGAFAGAAIGAQVAGLRQAAGATAEYAAAINQQRRALSGVVEDSAAYQQSLAFIDQTSRALAIPQEQVTRNFTRLAASVIGAGGNVDAAQEAFMGISSAILGTGGTLADLDAALLATAQVFSKGKVSAEELRGQIGERLPGAFTLFAESVGKTPAELDKMLEKGQVSLNDFMKFVRLASSDYGKNVVLMSESSEAAGRRLATTWARMQEEIGKALQPIGAEFQDTLSRFLSDNETQLVELAKGLAGAAKAFLDLAISVGPALVELGKFVLSFGAGTLAIKAFTTAVPFVLAALRLMGAQFIAASQQVALAEARIVNFGKTVRALAASLAVPIVLTIAIQGIAQVISNLERVKRLKQEVTDLPSVEDFISSRYKGSAVGPQDRQQLIRDLEETNEAVAKQQIVAGKAQTKLQELTAEAKKFFSTSKPKADELLVARAEADKELAALNNLIERRKELGRLMGTVGTGSPSKPFEFQTDPTAGVDKGTSGPKPPEDRTMELRAQLALFIQVAEYEDRIRDLRRDGRERLAIETELAKELAQIEAERIANLRNANYEGERAAFNTLAEAKAVDARRKSEDALRQLATERFKQEVQNRQAVRDAGDTINNIRKQQEYQLSDSKEYLRLIQEGMLPAEAQRIVQFERAVLLKKEELDTQIAITEEEIARARASNKGISTVDMERSLSQLQRERQAIVDAAAAGPGRAATDVERVEAGLAAAQGALNELTNLGNIAVTVANNIGNAFGEAFNKLVTGAGSARQVLSEFFQDVANSFFKMAQEIIAQQIVMITLQAILKALGGAVGGGGGATSFGADNPVGDFAFGAAGPIPAETSFPTFAKGNAFTPQGPVERYAKGGIVNAPTLFRYAKGGTFAPGLMGEAGPEAILPLRRTPDGRLGVTQVRSPQDADRMREMMGRSPAQQQAPMLNLKFETTTINGVEYVSREQLEVAMTETRKRASKEGAERGMSMTLDKMRNSPRTRAQVGMR